MDNPSFNEFIPGYFGKLPSFADFIKYNAAGTELLNFDRWIQEGMIKLKLTIRTGWEKHFTDSSGFQFLYFDAVSKNLITGNMYPSRDKSGRLFPFLTFLKINNFKNPGNNFHSIPILIKPYLKNAKLISEETGSAANLGELNLRFERIMRASEYGSSEQELNKYLNTENILDFTEKNFRSRLTHENFREIIKNAISKGQNLLKPFTLKVYLAKENSPETLFFLIKMFEKKISSSISALFWSLPGQGMQPLLFIFCGKLVPRNFVDLFYLQNKAEELIEINPVKTFSDPSLFNESKNNPAVPESNYTLFEFLENFN